MWAPSQWGSCNGVQQLKHGFVCFAEFSQPPSTFVDLLTAVFIVAFISQVISKDLFGVLKDQRGANFTSFISDKITIVPGDVTCENLGINDLNLSHEIFTEVDVVINLAATTKFDERYEKLILIVQIKKSNHS